VIWSLIKCVGAYHNASRDQLATGRAKPALANERGPQQCQRLLGQAPLATADEDVDRIALVSQSEILLLEDSIWSAHGIIDPNSSNAANRLQKFPARSEPAT
jgi:hypothetical protein